MWTVDRVTGERTRLFCLICKDEGRDWTSGTLCEHVKNAAGVKVDAHQFGQALSPLNVS